MPHKSTITYADALRYSAPANFSTMVKPVGSACNLACRYCYYLEKADIYHRRQAKMSAALLERYIERYISSCASPVVTFVWHGGEPLLAGLDYFRLAMKLQKQHAGGKKIENALQTNGQLVTQEWCKFFRAHGFLVGISIDGPQDIHDAYRRTHGDKPSFAKVMQAVALMSRMGVEYNTLSVVSNLSEGHGAEVYRFLKSIGSRFMQLLPALEHTVSVDAGSNRREAIAAPGVEGSRLAPWSVSAKGFGEFMCDVFDEWVISDVGRCYVQLFDVALAQWVGAPPGLCAFSETCGDALVVEHNGDVYSCDHFVYPEHKLGNIQHDELPAMLASPQQLKFGADKRSGLPRECLRCRYYFACRGECPKHRFDLSADGEKNKNALCEGYKLFFAHVDPYMKYMAERLLQKQAPALVMPWAQARIKGKLKKSHSA
ncbi:MAG: anaerobic sulfatase-maturation protein [Prevotellaceae bacterium]|nr:anaerobic sulfatase-maturation protein [Prevotellaceae bacterium]